jgi:hypothetical protein
MKLIITLVYELNKCDFPVKNPVSLVNSSNPGGDYKLKFSPIEAHRVAICKRDYPGLNIGCLFLDKPISLEDDTTEVGCPALLDNELEG